ncbi:hypothetical protein [Polymorphobacter sp.]
MRYWLKVSGRLFGDSHSTLKAARKAAEELKVAMPDAVVAITGIRK